MSPFKGTVIYYDFMLFMKMPLYNRNRTSYSSFCMLTTRETQGTDLVAWISTSLFQRIIFWDRELQRTNFVSLHILTILLLYQTHNLFVSFEFNLCFSKSLLSASFPRKFSCYYCSLAKAHNSYADGMAILTRYIYCLLAYGSSCG